MLLPKDFNRPCNLPYTPLSKSHPCINRRRENDDLYKSMEIDKKLVMAGFTADVIRQVARKGQDPKNHYFEFNNGNHSGKLTTNQESKYEQVTLKFELDLRGHFEPNAITRGGQAFGQYSFTLTVPNSEFDRMLVE